jgi:hypothetical protein
MFGAFIEEYEENGSEVKGTVTWPREEENQKFSWLIELDEKDMLRIQSLCNFLYTNRLIKGDKINLMEGDLIAKLTAEGWNYHDAIESINGLCSFGVDMIDDGEKTDLFYVHF